MSYDKESFMKGLAVGRILWKPPREIPKTQVLKFTVPGTSGTRMDIGPGLLWPGVRGIVRWGDGAEEEFSIPEEETYPRLSHPYYSSGPCQVEMRYDSSSPHVHDDFFFDYFANTIVVSVDTPFPELFSEVTSFKEGFRGCAYLVRLPRRLFFYCRSILTVEDCFRWDYRLEETPDDLFAYSPLISDFSGCFADTGITRVPPLLYDKCALATNFVDTYRDCYDLQKAPDLWVQFPDANGRSCFSGCTYASNYDDIPWGWK